MDKASWAILKTLSYADIFDFPLRKEELWRFLIGDKVTHAEFVNSLQTLLKKKQIGQLNNYFFLKNRAEIVNLRQKRQRIAQSKLNIAAKVIHYLKLIPTIDLLAISGSLAMDNTEAQEDIDLFIISAPHTLFITRFLVTLVLDAINVRRKPQDSWVKNKICPNMWLDGSKLKLPVTERNLFVAHEIAQLKPLFSRHQTYEKFLMANNWLKKFMPHIKIDRLKLEKPRSYPPVKVMRFLENLLKNWQLNYMKKRRTSEKISATLLKFHPHDVSAEVLDKYKSRLDQFGIKS